MNEDDWAGFSKYQDAKAIVIVAAFIPYLPLMLADEFGLTRGWLWYGWAVIAVGWTVVVFGFVLWSSAISLAAYFRNRRDKKK